MVRVDRAYLLTSVCKMSIIGHNESHLQVSVDGVVDFQSDGLCVAENTLYHNLEVEDISSCF